MAQQSLNQLCLLCTLKPDSFLDTAAGRVYEPCLEGRRISSACTREVKPPGFPTGLLRPWDWAPAVQMEQKCQEPQVCQAQLLLLKPSCALSIDCLTTIVSFSSPSWPRAQAVSDVVWAPYASTTSLASCRSQEVGPSPIGRAIVLLL